MSDAQNSKPDTEVVQQDENHVMAERREKLKAIREKGVAFPNDFQPEHAAQSLHDSYDALEGEDLEARALSVAILDHLAESVRGELGLTVESFPVGRLMEAGTWAAGCKIALAKRPAGSPPVQIDSDGAAFFPL